MFSWRRVWTQLPSGMWRRVVFYKCTSVSEEPTASTSIYTDDGGRWFLWNVRKLVPDCTALYIRRKQSSLLKMAGRQEFLPGMWRQEISNFLSVQRHSHVKITFKLGNYCILHLSLFTVCYLTALLWKISGALQLQRKIPKNTPVKRGDTRFLTVYNANINAR